MPSESKVICALSLHNNSLPIKATGQSGRWRNSCLTSCFPRSYLESEEAVGSLSRWAYEFG
jgi:hypothetical protein